jgi:outer membrane biosynthesis protein TonB
VVLRYNIPLYAIRQPHNPAPSVRLGAAGERLTPPTRANRPCRTALAVALLLHGVVIVPALLLVSGLVPPAPPDSTPVEMVLLAPATSEQPVAQSRPTAAGAPAQPPEAQPPPQADSARESAEPPLPETLPPEPRPAPAPAPQAKPHPPQLRRPPARSKSPPHETATTAPPTAASSQQSSAAPAEAAPTTVSINAGWRQALAAWLAQCAGR